MRPGDISVSAIRTTPVSTPLRVRTRVVIAKAMISRLAAMPSRFQPIRFLKPRPSVVSSPCIHPPGRAGCKLKALSPTRLSHSVYMSQRKRFEPCIHLSGSPTVHLQRCSDVPSVMVLVGRRNIDWPQEQPRGHSVSAGMRNRACRRWKEQPAPCSQNKKDASNGTLYPRHQDNERPVRASVAGHLLRREAACEGASENGREGDRPAAQAGFPDPSR